MRIILSSLASAGFLVIGGNTLAAEAPKTMSDCVQIADDDKRLACFDELAKEPAAAKPSLMPEENTVLPETTVQKERRLFGLSFSRRPQSEEEYGLQQPSPPARIEVSEISANIRTISFSSTSPSRNKPANSIVLDNGQIWRQLDSDTRYLRPLKEGVTYTATIKRGAVGSFRMTVEPTGQTIRVRRIK